MNVWAANIQCAGNEAICEGTEERDTIQGASIWDQILAHGGDDVVRGGGDGDSIQGETGDDRPYGDQCICGTYIIVEVE
jgi:hypothetical protein